MYKLMSILRWPIFSLLAAYMLLGAVMMDDCPDGIVTNVAFIPNSSSALVRRSPGEIELWDVPTGKNLPFTLLPFETTNTEVPLNTSRISCPRNEDNSTEDAAYLGFMRYVAWGMAVSNSGSLIAAANPEGHVLLWDLETRQLRCELVAKSLVQSIAFSNDDSKLLTGSSDKLARLWDVDTGTVVQTFTGHEGEINSVAFSPDNTQVLTGSDDGTARLWDTSTGSQVAKFQYDKEQGSYDREVGSVAFSPDGKTAAIGTWDSRVRLWDIKTGSIESTLKEPLSGGVDTVSFTSDGRFLLTAGSWDSKARLWDIATGKVIQVFSGHSDWIKTGTISQDNRYALTGGFDSSARLWDMQTGSQLHVFCPSFIGIPWYFALFIVVVIAGLSLWRFFHWRRNKPNTTTAAFRSERNMALRSLLLGFVSFAVFFFWYVPVHYFGYYAVPSSIVNIGYLIFFIWSTATIAMSAYQNYHFQHLSMPQKSSARLAVSAVAFVLLMLFLVGLFTAFSFFMIPIP